MRFNLDQLEALRNEFGTINYVNPARLNDFHALFNRCPDETLRQLALARIKFVSTLAVNTCLRRGVKVR